MTLAAVLRWDWHFAWQILPSLLSGLKITVEASLMASAIARVANGSPDPLRFLSDFRDEIKAVVGGINIAGTEETAAMRGIAQKTIDEMFSLMKPPSAG